MVNITEIIETWMDDLNHNALEPGSELRAFSKPVIGFAAGEDELFQFIKNDIGPNFYWTPIDAFKAAFPDEKVAPNELSVIAWILPQTEHTRLAHRQAVDKPSSEWSKSISFRTSKNRLISFPKSQ